MKELFTTMLFLALMASTVANFWTLCLRSGMILGRLGNTLRRIVELERAQWDVVDQMPRNVKFLKGLLCNFCVAIWILTIIHILYFHIMKEESITVSYSIFIFFFEVGVTTFINKVTSVYINQKLEL